MISSQNTGRPAELERDQQEHLRSTPYFRISVAIRIIIIAVTVMAFYPARFPDPGLKKVDAINYKYYYTGRWFTKKKTWYELATHDGYYLPAKRFAHIAAGDSIRTFRNVIGKKVAVQKKGEKYLYTLSDPFPTHALLVIVSVFSILSFRKKYRYNTQRINFLLIAGWLLIWWYYGGYGMLF